VALDFRWSEIEQQLADALPEIWPAADFYWETEGQPGQDSGPYIFFEDLFARYVEVLLWIPTAPRRDELLRRSFAIVEQMLASADPDVQTLAAIGLLEGREPAWLKRASAFIGPRAAAWLTTYDPNWRDWATATDQIVPEILDGYHVRAVVAQELGLPIEQVPGRTYVS
jgi:hypothetical protein